MALISDQAFTRHQYQRSMNTETGSGPQTDQQLPALFHAAEEAHHHQGEHHEHTVAMREAMTCARRAGIRLEKRR